MSTSHRLTIGFRLSLASICCAALLSSCASAPTTGEMTGRAASRSDREARANDLFTLFDANGDGYLTKAELENGLRSAATTWEPNPNLMMGLGPDGAKKPKKPKAHPLSDAQIKRAMSNAFKSHDKKLDDRISRDEFKKVVAEGDGNADDPWAPFM